MFSSFFHIWLTTWLVLHVGNFFSKWVNNFQLPITKHCLIALFLLARVCATLNHFFLEILVHNLKLSGWIWGLPWTKFCHSEMTYIAQSANFQRLLRRPWMTVFLQNINRYYRVVLREIFFYFMKQSCKLLLNKKTTNISSNKINPQ